MYKNIGSLFPPLPRNSPSIRRVRRERNDRNGNITKEEFFEYVKHCIDVDRKNHFIR